MRKSLRRALALAATGPLAAVALVTGATAAHAVVILRTAHSVTLPTVTSTPGAGACPTTLLSMDDPGDVVLSVGADAGARTVCRSGCRR